MNPMKILSVFVSVTGFLMPFIVRLFVFFRGDLLSFTFIRNGFIYWIFPALFLWCLSIVLWGDKSRYWVMWVLLGTILPIVGVLILITYIVLNRLY
jgi:hypothetical protein